MRRCAALLLLAGCGDPTLDVIFRIDARYRDSINSAALRIYHPLPAAPFDCDQLAFDKVDPDVLRLSLASEISLITSSEAPLEVDRTGDKLFWVEGLDGQARRLVTGCAEMGDVEENTEIVIQAEPTKVLTVASSPSLSVESGAALETPIVFQVNDLDARALSGVEVRWEIDGAGGSGSSGSAQTGDDGKAAVLPTLPTRPGPFVLDVGVRWAAEDPDPVTGFVRPEPEIGFLPGRVHDYRGGDVGPNAEAGFAALIEDANGFKVVYVFRNSGGEIQMRVSQNIVTLAPKLGLIDPPRDGERARAIVIGFDDWTEIGINGELISKVYVASGNVVPVDVEMSGSCEPGSPPQIFVSYSDETFGIFNDEAQGNLFVFNSDADLIASGCVTDEIGGATRLLILSDSGQNLFATYQVDDNFFGEGWLAIPSGIGFSLPIGTSKDRLLIGTQLSVNDVVISRFIIRTGSETLTLVQRDLDEPNGFPLFTDGGDIDGDGLLDIVSLLDQRADLQDPPSFGLWAALGRERDAHRITGDFPVPGSLLDPEMILIDFDNDGTDDAIVGERTPLEDVTQTRFYVYPMGEVTPQ